uniref:WxxW domain-containing protein n=1 Tax=Amphiprion ocellaris TaxID=80972 RepID=A0AAQ5YX04_AMPOC
QPQTPYLLLQLKTQQWSDWYNVHDPSTDHSDWETYENITNSGLQICDKRLFIDCRAVHFPDMDFNDYKTQTGQVVSCDVDYGLICKVEDQSRPPRKCFDYKIRVFSPTTTNPCITYEWSDWYNVHDPSTDHSDWETYENITNSGLQICDKRLFIDCRAVHFPDMDFNDYKTQTGQVVSCDVDYGLICKVEDQSRPPRKCHDYEIRPDQTNPCITYEWSDWYNVHDPSTDHS